MAGIDPSVLPRRCRVQISCDDFASEAREHRCEGISPYSEAQTSRSGTKDSAFVKSFDYESPLPNLTVEGSGYSGVLDIPRDPDLVGPSQERLRVDTRFRAEGGDQLGWAGASHDQTNGPETSWL